MAILESYIDRHADAFQRNAKVMGAAVDEFRDIEQRVIAAAEKKVPRYRERGLMPPRERLSALLDVGTPFLELSTLCGYMQEEDRDGEDRSTSGARVRA